MMTLDSGLLFWAMLSV